MKKQEIEVLEGKIADLQTLMKFHAITADSKKYRRIENILNTTYMQLESVFAAR